MISPRLALLVALLAIASALAAAHPIQAAAIHEEDVESAEDVDAEFGDEFLDVEESSTSMNMYLTCDNTFELFVNGKKICSGTDWTTTYHCQATIQAGDVIAIDGRDQGGPAAFIGVFNGVATTASDWRCKDTTSPGDGWNLNRFDDSSWPQAVSFGRNDASNVWRSVSGRSRPNIPAHAEWLWTRDNNNHDRVYCRYTPIKIDPAVVARAAAEAKAAADAKAAKEAADALAKTARDALAAHKGDHKAIFAEMMKQVKSGLTTMKNDVDNEFKAITSKRNAAQDVLNARITSAKQSEKSFSDATVALKAADQACTTARNTAVSTASTLAFATTSLNSRNPIIEKELAVIRQLVSKVGELKTINLQESADQEATRSAAYSSTRDMIASLQTFEQEAAPLSEMLEMAREHAEFTKPILDLLKQLEAKLQSELNSLKAAVTSAQSENTRAQSSSESSCGVRAVKAIEQATSQAQFNSAVAARDSAQNDFNVLERLWTSTRTKTESALQAYTQEMISINSLQTCAVRALNPIRKSCWEIKSLHPDAQSGSYQITGPDGQPLAVTCDMSGQGGGWTLAGVAIFGNHGQAGWNNEGFLNKGSSGNLNSHWHMSSDFMNALAENGEYRVNCFSSTNDYERLWKGVRNYKWSQVTAASSSTSLNGVSQFPTSWAGHHWGLTSGNNERDAVITSHSSNQWACAGNAGPNGEGYTGRGGRSNMRIWLR